MAGTSQKGEEKRCKFLEEPKRNVGDAKKEGTGSMATVRLPRIHFRNECNTVHHQSILFQRHVDAGSGNYKRVLYAFKSLW